MTTNEILRARVFEFLNKLRAQGTINMLAAAPRIRQAFGVSRREAEVLLSEWIAQLKNEDET